MTFYELQNGVYSRLRSLTTVFLMREFSSTVLVYSGSQAKILVSGHLRVNTTSFMFLLSSIPFFSTLVFHDIRKVLKIALDVP